MWRPLLAAGRHPTLGAMQHMHAEMAGGASGTLLGHVVAGAGFLAWGLWWLYRALRRGGDVPGAPVDPGLGAPLTKIAFVGVFLFFEMPNRGWQPHDIVMSTHHMTVYAGIGLTGFVDLLARSGRLAARATHLALAAAMFNAGFLFAVHGNPPGAESAAHLLLELTWIAVGAFALLEITYSSALARWYRIGAMTAAGTWLLLISWILFVSGWRLADPLSSSWTYLIFSWNVAAVGALVLIARIAVGRKAAPAPVLERAARSAPLAAPAPSVTAPRSEPASP